MRIEIIDEFINLNNLLLKTLKSLIEILDGPVNQHRSYSISYLIAASDHHFDLIKRIIEQKMINNEFDFQEDRACLINILGLYIATKNSLISQSNEITYDLFKYEIKDNLQSWTIYLKQQNKIYSDQISLKKLPEIKMQSP